MKRPRTAFGGLALVSALLLSAPSLTLAVPIAAVDVMGPGNSGNGQTQTQGWEFRTTVPIHVTALGIFNSDTDASPVHLMPGQNYVIGALYLGIQGGGTLDPDPTDRDLFIGIGSLPLRTFASDIEFIDPRISSQQTSGLLFPTVQSLHGIDAIVGPSFLFEVTQVREPPTWGLLGATLLGWSLLRRKSASRPAPLPE